MVKRTTFAVLLCIMSLTMWAGERSDEDMRAIAMQHFATSRANTRGMALNTDVCELARRASYSVYGLQEGQGFVIVGRSTAFNPILATSETSFDANNLADGLKWWMEAMDRSLQRREAPATTRAFTPVENFVETQWGQGAPYNSMTPEVGGKHCPTGCVATAMAQVLKYYNYPEQSEGISYYHVGDDPTDIRYEFKTTFKWDSIMVSYANKSTYGNQAIEAVGELMRDCGYSVKMNYNKNASGALYTDATLGFVRNMGLKEGYVHNAFRRFYSDEEWMGIVEAEMTAHRPILYGGTDGVSMGHAFVFSGLDADGKVYVNWGWDGSGDGYYDIASLVPEGPGVTGNNDFSLDQDMVFGITPNPDIATLHPKFSEWAFDVGNYVLKPSTTAGRISIDATGPCYNFYYTTFRGTIDLVVISNETGANQAFTIFSTEGERPYYGLDFLSIPPQKRLPKVGELPAGVYTAFLGSKAHSDVEYQPVRSSEGTIAYQLTIGEDGSIEISDPIKLIVITPTAIQGIGKDKVQPEGIYDLNGRYVGNDMNNLRRGIYIRNGKKVLR